MPSKDPTTAAAVAAGSLTGFTLWVIGMRAETWRRVQMMNEMITAETSPMVNN